MISEELIHRFLQQRCTRDEALEVMILLELDPAALDVYLPEAEAMGETETLQPEVSARMLAAVKKKSFGAVRRLRLYRWMAAAAVFVLVTLSALWLQHRSPVSQAVTKPQPALKEIANHSAKAQHLALPDGSLVELAPASAIRYHPVFDSGGQRRVYLSGKALFQVTANAASPFRVQTEELLVTVLGTSFSVSAFPRSRSITIQLNTGKIMVSGMPPAGRYLSHDFYLQPGDVLMYDKQTRVASVKHMQPPASQPLLNRVPRSQAPGRQPVEQPDWYAFKGQALPQVLDQLSDYYGVDIRYSPADLKNKYFFGSFTRADSLDAILRDIALVNGLTVTRHDSGYVLRKQK
jgi:ferric-dicitrate binding protein FerR (iron transport regulator)